MPSIGSILEGARGRLPALWALLSAPALAALALPALLACAGPPAFATEPCTAPAAARPIAVRFAIDGDTVRLVDGRSLRLTAINALETGKRGAPDEPFAHQASVRLGELLRQGPPRFIAGREPFDRHGRALGELYAADGRLIAATLAAEGLAFAVAVAPNLAAVECVAAAERAARLAKRGLWADPAAWTVAARDADAGLRGFRRVTGTVSAVTPKRGGRVLELDGRLELWLPDEAIGLDALRARARPGLRLAARGWWGSFRGRPSLRIEHPAVVELAD